jgi:hypothetical protein
MPELQEIVQNEYTQWENTPPSVVNEGLGYISKPLEFVLRPIMNKVAPRLEGVVSKTNKYIADAIEKVSDKTPDFENMDEKSFKEWFAKADKSASIWKALGFASMTAEGAGTGVGGFAFLLIDIPVAFGLILGFSNKIALTYGLPIEIEDIQKEILQSILVGSESNLNDKMASAIALKQTQKTLKMSWKKIYELAADNAIVNINAKMVATVREFLQKLGVKITHKKANQSIPVLAAGIGAAINGAWASDALEAVRQYSRKWIVEKYYLHES